MSLWLRELAVFLVRVPRDILLVLLISTCLAQVTKRTPHSWYYFFFIVILIALSVFPG